ncbi:MAG: hypothetical protein WC551_10610 [Patescibacteria group bacterium]
MKAVISLAIILMLCGPASAVEYYVNGDTGSNANDGLTPSTPFTTINYACSTLAGGTDAEHDTVYVTGFVGAYTEPINYVLDCLKIFDLVGLVGPSGDSPTITVQSATLPQAFMGSSVPNSNQVIDGFYFKNCITTTNLLNFDRAAGVVIRNNVFDSNTLTLGSSIKGTALIYITNVDAGETGSCYFHNDIVYRVPQYHALVFGGNNAAPFRAYINDCTFDSVPTLISAYDAYDNFIYFTNSIVSPDTLITSFDELTNNQDVAIDFTNCDTWGQELMFVEFAPVNPTTVVVTTSNIIDVDPNYDTTTEPALRFYWDQSVGNASTTNGHLGTNWQYLGEDIQSSYVSKKNNWILRWRQIVGLD